MKVAFITIATGSYRSFVPNLVASSRRHVVGCSTLDWLVLGDRRPRTRACSFRRVPSRNWPFSTLMRFHDMLAHREALAGADYIAYVDSDMRFVDQVDVSEWQGNYIAVRHPGYLQSDMGPFEHRAESRAAVSPQYRGPYVQGCLFGGDSTNFWKLCETLRGQVEDDLARGIIAEWHDESHLNAYFSQTEAKILDSGFAYPEGWALNVKPRILHLKKHHDLIRAKGLKKIRIVLYEIARFCKQLVKKALKATVNAF